MRNKRREVAAEETAGYVLRLSSYRPETGIILGTGWGDVLMKNMADHKAFSLADLPGFPVLRGMPQIAGHRRELVVGNLKTGRSVAMIRGRIHLNEMHNSEELVRMVRLQVEMLVKIGVKNLILTNAAGSLKKKVRVGEVVAHDGFITLFAPPRPLYAGEFVSPEDTLKDENNVKILTAAREANLVCHLGAGAMVRGPDFEGRKHDKRILRQFGATVAMMSILPEAAVAALYPEVKVYAISFITNNAMEEHSHEENQRRAAESSAKLGTMLLNLVGIL